MADFEEIGNLSGTEIQAISPLQTKSSQAVYTLYNKAKKFATIVTAVQFIKSEGFL